MRRVRRNVLGLLGLFLVVAVTFFAANLPNPSATATSSVTDTVIVRVVGKTPDVNINAPENGQAFVDPNCEIKIDYANVGTVTVELTYTDTSGVEHPPIMIATLNPDYEPGDETIPLNLDDYGHGEFLLKLTGIGKDGVKDTEMIRFSYTSIYTTLEEDPVTGRVYLNLYYPDSLVDKLDVYIYLGDELIVPPSPIRVNSPTHRIELNFDGFKTGDYRIKTVAYARGTGEIIGDDFEDYYYETAVVPDTGGFFRSGNISREDFIITGLIAFAAFGGIAIWIIAKGRKNNRLYSSRSGKNKNIRNHKKRK